MANVFGTIFDEGGAVFNVKNTTFGATGDGVTDDTDAIQAALDAAQAAGGGTVFIPQGTYMVSRRPPYGAADVVLRLHSGVTLQGAGRGATVLRLGANSVSFARILTAQNVERITVRDLTLDGNQANNQVGAGGTPDPVAPYEHNHAIYLDGAEDVLVANVECTQCTGDGIGLRGTTRPTRRLTVQDSWIHQNLRNGITLGSGYQQIVVASTYIADNEDSCIDSEPHFGDNHTVLVTGCSLVAGLNGIAITTGGWQEFNAELGRDEIGLTRDFRVVGCSIHGRVHSLYNEDVVISGNVITVAPDTPAVMVYRTVRGYVLSGNRVVASGEPCVTLTTDGATDPATGALLYPTDVRLADNELIQQGNAPGIRISTSRRVHVSGNQVSGAGLSQGILVTPNAGDTQDVVVAGNTVRNFVTGLSIGAVGSYVTRQLSITGNLWDDDQVTATMTTGVRFSSSTAVVVDRLLIANNNAGPAVTTAISGHNSQVWVTGGSWGAIADFSLAGSPAGVLAAPLGSTARSRTGGAGTTFFVKETGGSTSTGWVAK